MKKLFFLLALPLALCFAACGDDDDKDSPKGESESKEVVVIDENGNASNGADFEAINDVSFYLDHIQYSILNGHLVVSGYDKEDFNGVAKIVANIKYKGTKYKVEEIGNGNYDYYAFEGCKDLTSITIPNTVKSIGSWAFSECKGLTSITLPESLTTIGHQSFMYCTSLTSLTIPKNVTKIGEQAFAYCWSLSSIKVDKGNTQFDSRDNCNAIIETKTNTLVAGCQKTVIPNSVTDLLRNAFEGCSELTSITIPNSVTSIGFYTFKSCYKLKSIKLPEDLTSIGYSVFDGCYKLESITIPESVTSIGAYAFYSCESLTDIVIPKNVTSMGEGMFSKCSKLNKVHFRGTTPPKCSSKENLSFIFYQTGTSGYPFVYVPKGAASIYKQAFGNIVSVFEEN